MTSGLSVGIPGTLQTWQRAVNQWGRFPLAGDLAPADAVATRGFPVTATLREQVRENAFRFDQFSSTSALFLPHGQLPVVGSTMKNPALARTYALIGRKGVGVFYGGAIGRDVVRTVHDLPLVPGATLVPRPGSMTLADLAHYRAPDVAPTHVRYRGYDVYSMAPSSSGGTTVGEALNILSNFDLGAESPVQVLHHYLEASRLAFADRNRYIGDPRYVQVPEAELLSPAFGRQRACLIDPAHALISPVAPGDPFAGAGGCTPQPAAGAADAYPETDTNHLVVADQYGDVASYTNTIEELGGSGIVVLGRGFLLNNELTDFDFAPPSSGLPDPNLPAGGKRPRSSMSPTIVLRHRRPVLALGAAGGATIITTVLQTLINRIDLHMSLPAGDRRPPCLAAQLIDDAGRAGVHRRADHGRHWSSSGSRSRSATPRRSIPRSRSRRRSGSRAASSCSRADACWPRPSRSAGAEAPPASSARPLTPGRSPQALTPAAQPRPAARDS